jgi:transcriptional regulator with XRE-family HTH domain
VRSNDHEMVVAILKAARLECGLTQRDLADKLGVAQWLIGRLETGERNVSVIEFIAWARALEIDPHALLAKLLG